VFGVRRIIVGMTGATGAILGIRVLEALKEAEVERHLVASKWARQTIEHETTRSYEDVCALADAVYSSGDMGAAISSGSYETEGMIVAPCSMRSLAAIAHGQGDTLVHRAADVVLKERRKLVLVVRETPLNDIHLENMLKLSRMGVTILPPMLAFYFRPKSLEDVIDHVVARILDQFSVPVVFAKRWDGKMRTPVVPFQSPDRP
jgi:4-hydroxy-3-polyprenylbenzoate decarboxylase